MPSTWSFRFDPQNQGESGKWFAENVAGDWKKIQVPGSYDVEFPDQKFYQGKAWYRTTFKTPVSSGPKRETILHLDGVVLRCKVWVNGELAGESVVPFTALNFDISRFLQPGQSNLLVIETDNSIQTLAIPDKKWHGWWNDGGLIWPVSLETRPLIHNSAKIATSMDADGKWKLAVHVTTHNGGSPSASEITLRVTDRQGKTVWKTDRKIEVPAGESGSDFVADLHSVAPWSPRHPNLYRLQIASRSDHGATDSVAYPFGFRQIAVRGTELLLNGKRIVLRGINRHEMYPGEGMTLTPEQNLKDLEDIKAMGANFVRLPHYPQTKDVYDDCDRLGLLVWTEIPAWQTSAESLESPEVWAKYAVPELTTMVRQHWNHPSVIIWSVGNEFRSNEPGVAQYVQRAVDLVHRLDSTRLATFASSHRDKDVSFGPVDIISVNEYYGWYYGKTDELGPDLDLIHEKWSNKPVMVSEFGAGAVRGWKNDPSDSDGRDYSLEHQVTFLKAHLEQMFDAKRSSYFAGSTIWVYNDFPDPNRNGHGHPKSATYVNAKGLVTQTRQHKPSYAMVQAFYKKLQRQEAAGKFQ